MVQTNKHPNNNNIYTNKHESLRIQPYFRFEKKKQKKKNKKKQKQ